MGPSAFTRRLIRACAIYFSTSDIASYATVQGNGSLHGTERIIIVIFGTFCVLVFIVSHGRWGFSSGPMGISSGPMEILLGPRGGPLECLWGPLGVPRSPVGVPWGAFGVPWGVILQKQ